MSMVKNSDYPVANLEPLGKRKKLEEEFTNGPLKKQRTRVSFSCGECHRRKQKCDRQVPCSHCVARKVPELCKAYTPGKADQDLNARVTRLEQIIEMALPPQFLTPGASNSPLSVERNHTPSHHNNQRTSPNGDDDKSQAEDQDPGTGTFLSGKWYGPSVSGSIAPGSLIEQIEHVAGTDTRPEQGANGSHSEDQDGVSSSPQASNFASGGSPADDLEQAAVDNLQRLVQECGVTPQKISELLQELPEIPVADQLIDFYFHSINWTRYPISEIDFRAAYSSICGAVRGRGTASNPQDIRFLPLLCVVLAIAARLAPEHLGGDARHRRATSLRYYWASRRALLIAAAVQPDSLDMVLTRLLSARFLTFDRRITECWSQLGAAVRTAQALGLHRDGMSMGIPQRAVEYRRRIWSYLLHADRSYALVLGRPNSIQDAYTSSKPPSNMEGEPQDSRSLEVLPLTQPTTMTFVILRHQLAEIIGRMVHHFQQVRERSHYSEVIALDDELLAFIKHLPPHFSLNPDTSLDISSPFIPVHRFLLITEILFVRISLHRPYLLRRVHSERYARSRNACFESAIRDFEVRQGFRETAPQEVRDSLGNSYREFQAAMISGIYFILEPKGPHSDAMHTILDGFVKDHEGMRDMDETTRRELKTIEFLKNKASQMIAQGIQPRRTKGLEESFSRSKEQQAQLLLSLGKPVTSPTLQSQLVMSGTMDHSPSPHSPPLSRSVVQSPTLSRLQYASQPHSPTTSGSPHAEEDSSAQTLLDTWYNSFSTAVEPSASGLPWPGYIGQEVLGWANNTFPGPGNSNLDPRLLAGLDGSDTSYLEALVNQIHADAHSRS